MEIDGLSPKHVEMLEIMWTIDSKADLYDWIANLPSDKERKMAYTLLNMLLIEAVDECIRETDSYPEANEVLSRFMQ